MATMQRRIEVHRLTISGLPENQPYGSFLKNLRGRGRPVEQMVKRLGTKSHALNSAELRNRRLYMRFLSYTRGHRPDILDTDQFQIVRNPLTPSQTGVEWTHVLGGQRGDRYVLLIERNNTGLWPTSLEQYLQWMADRYYQPPDGAQDAEREAVTISLEAEPGHEFLQRVNALDRIMEATVRIVRPNPGWRDLETDLGDVAQQSDAHKAEIHMNARRMESLKRNDGILGWIRSKFQDNELDFAAIKGKRRGQTDTFNTAKLGKNEQVSFELDDFGQVVPNDAWEKLSGVMDRLD